MPDEKDKEREDLCKQIDRAIEGLAQVKQVIEHDNLNEVSINSLRTMCTNLPNRIKEYIDRSNMRSAYN